MVKKTEVMIGDIICLYDRAFEIKEIHKNSVDGEFLHLPYGFYGEAWAKAKPFFLTVDLLNAIGFRKGKNYLSETWVYKTDAYEVNYRIVDNSLSILGLPPKAGFAYCYIPTLHELMHQFKTYNIDTVHIYKQMKNYKLPYSKPEV